MGLGLPELCPACLNNYKLNCRIMPDKLPAESPTIHSGSVNLSSLDSSARQGSNRIHTSSSM